MCARKMYTLLLSKIELQRFVIFYVLQYIASYLYASITNLLTYS